jgi:hypothetical protein
MKGMNLDMTDYTGLAGVPASDLSEGERDVAPKSVSPKQRKFVCRYEYSAPGNPAILRKTRYEVSVPPAGRGSASPPGKEFKMLALRRPGWQWCRPSALPDLMEFFDSLLYGLDSCRDGCTVYSCEGEKDADAVISRGKSAVSHWKGAGSFTAGQADRIAALQPRRVIVVADLDEPGAYDALKRRDKLLKAGIPADRVRLAEPALGAPGTYATAHGADLSDHIDAGKRLRELRQPDIAVMKAASEREAERRTALGAAYYTKNTGNNSGLNL